MWYFVVRIGHDVHIHFPVNVYLSVFRFLSVSSMLLCTFSCVSPGDMYKSFFKKLEMEFQVKNFSFASMR